MHASRLPLFPALALLLIAETASSDVAPGMLYRAELAADSFAQGQVAGTAWTCSAKTCTATLPKGTPLVVACQILTAQAGRVRSVSAAGQSASADDLAQCARTALTEVVAVLDAPATKPTFTTGSGLTWTCAGTRCTTRANVDANVAGCFDLARAAGRVRSYAHGDAALGASELLACNTLLAGPAPSLPIPNVPPIPTAPSPPPPRPPAPSAPLPPAPPVVPPPPNALTPDVFVSRLGPTLDNLVGSPGGSSWAGRMISIASSANGQRVYAGTVSSGLWRSDDGGVTFRQLTRKGGRVFPPDTIHDVVVWPRDPDVVVVAGALGRKNMESGIYRSVDGGASWELAHTLECQDATAAHADVTQIAFAPDDDTKLWAVGCRVAFSTADFSAPNSPKPLNDAATLKPYVAKNWTNAAAPATPDAASGVFHLAVGPRAASGDRVVWACGPSAMWRSSNGGQVFNAVRWTRGELAGACGGPWLGGGRAAPSVLAMDPADPDHLFLASRAPSSARVYFDSRDEAKEQRRRNPDGSVCGAPLSTPGLPAGGCGEGSLHELRLKKGLVLTASRLPVPPVLWGAGTVSGAISVQVVPQAGGAGLVVFVDTDTVHVAELRGGQLVGANPWHRLDGFDPSDLCPQAGAATCNGGGTAPRSRTSDQLVHKDPHALAWGARFDLSLKDASGAAPYLANRSLDRCTNAPLFLANDGGVYRSGDCGRTWTPARVLLSHAATELAGFSVAGGPPALYYGTQDNNLWFSPDGGGTWKAAADGCGDCGGFFALPTSTRVVAHFPRDDYQSILLFPVDRPGAAPDASLRAIRLLQPPGTLGSTARNTFPIAAPMPLDTVAADTLGTFVNVVAEPSPGGRAWKGIPKALRVVEATPRLAGPLEQARGRDLPASNFSPVGPPLPPPLRATPDQVAVQASGSRAARTYYVRAPDQSRNGWHSLVRSSRSGDVVTGWDCVVPGAAVVGVHDGRCRQANPGEPAHVDFYRVHPYLPSVVYVADRLGIFVTTDAGQTWRRDTALEALLTEGGDITAPFRFFEFDGERVGILQAMELPPSSAAVRFAAGEAGVFYTTSGLLPGAAPTAVERWQKLLDARDVPCGPSGLFFDPPSRSLYVSCKGASILRLGPIPTHRDARLGRVLGP